MDPNTTPNAFGDELYEAMAPLAYADAANDYALKTICYALAQMFKQLELLVRTDDDGNLPWSIIMDADRAPDYMLPYIAQFVGQTIPTGMSEADARALIKAPSNSERGTRASLIENVEKYLTGTKHISLRERDTSPWHATMNILSGESGIANGTYVVNQANASLSPIIQALLDNKPVGIVLELIVSNGITIDELVGTIDAQTGTIDNL